MAIFNNPFPVLDNSFGNFSNYQFSVECISSKVENGIYSFGFKSAINEPIILDLIENKKVCFCIQLDCKPFIRKIYKAEDLYDEVTFEINYEDIPSNFHFEFTPLLITETPLDYKNENADTPICNYTFKLQKNQIIGSHTSLKISFETGYETFESSPIIKFFRLNPPEKPKNGSMDIRLDLPFIKVSVSSEDFDLFTKVNSLESKLLDTVVTFPILQYTLHEFINDKESYLEKEWAQNLNNQFNIFDINDSDEILNAIHYILKSPHSNFFDFYIKKYEIYTND
jgi:hypothetical protein